MWGICQTEDDDLKRVEDEIYDWNNLWGFVSVWIIQWNNLTVTKHSTPTRWSFVWMHKVKVYLPSQKYTTFAKKNIQASKATRYNKQANWKLIIKMLKCVFCIRYIHKQFPKAVGTKQQSHSNFVKLVINSYSYNLLTPHWQIGLVWRIVLFF